MLGTTMANYGQVKLLEDLRLLPFYHQAFTPKTHPKIPKKRDKKPSPRLIFSICCHSDTCEK
jgi:hypothetical protein